MAQPRMEVPTTQHMPLAEMHSPHEQVPSLVNWLLSRCQQLKMQSPTRYQALPDKRIATLAERARPEEVLHHLRCSAITRQAPIHKAEVETHTGLASLEAWLRGGRYQMDLLEVYKAEREVAQKLIERSSHIYTVLLTTICLKGSTN